MESQVKVVMKIETEVSLEDGQFLIKEQPTPHGTPMSVYVTADRVACFVGRAYDPDELFDLVSPNNILHTLDDCASEYEWDVIYTALQESHYYYYIGEDLYRIMHLYKVEK